jgi:hypothetical protein
MIRQAKNSKRLTLILVRQGWEPLILWSGDSGDMAANSSSRPNL